MSDTSQKISPRTWKAPPESPAAVSIAGALHREAANSAARSEPLDKTGLDAGPAPVSVEDRSQDPLRSNRQRRASERRTRDPSSKNSSSKKKARRVATREAAAPETSSSSVLTPVADTNLSLFQRCLRGLAWLFSGGLGSLPKPWRLGALAVIGLLAAVILRLGTPDTAEERMFDSGQASNETGESVRTGDAGEAGVDDGPIVVTVVEPAPVQSDEATVDEVVADEAAADDVARSELPDTPADASVEAVSEALSDESVAAVSVPSSADDDVRRESAESPVAEVDTGTGADTGTPVEAAGVDAAGETETALTPPDAPPELTVSVPVEQLETVLRENEELESRVAELARTAPAADAPADSVPVVDALVTVLRENVELESLVAELEAETTELESNLLELDLQVLALEKNPSAEGVAAAPIELGNSSLIPAPVDELSAGAAPLTDGAAPGMAPSAQVEQPESFLPSGIFDDYENSGGTELPVDEAAAFDPQAGRATYTGSLPPSAGALDAGNFDAAPESAGAGARVERVAITDVPVGSSAEAAGVVPGDILLAVDGREIVRLGDLDPYLNGDPAPLHELELLRDDRRQWVDLAGSPAELALATRYIDPARLTLD